MSSVKISIFSFFTLLIISVYFKYVNATDSDPLLLTPLIENNQILKAQEKSRVKPFLPGVKSYSGYITVDKNHNSNLFFWFFRKTSDWKSAPLLLWLNGGPGYSSLYGLFTENGPYQFQKGKLIHRKTSWTHHFNVLFVDNPVGTGFSFTESVTGYVTNQTSVGEHLHEMLRQFMLLFPELQKNDLILTGESYAGKYLLSLADTIYKKKLSTKPALNLFGVFMGNSIISMEHMLVHYSDFLYSHGMLDSINKEILREQEEEIIGLIRNENWPEATDLFQKTYSDKKETLFYKLTGKSNIYNMHKDSQNPSKDQYDTFLQQNDTKMSLHVGDIIYHRNSDIVFEKLKADVSKSHITCLQEVLEHTHVLIMSGQLDIRSPCYVIEHVLKELSWSGAWDYYNAERNPIYWGNQLSGYYKTALNLVEVLIRNSGHMAPADKPRWSLGLLKKFTEGSFLNKPQELKNMNIHYDSEDF